MEKRRKLTAEQRKKRELHKKQIQQKMRKIKIKKIMLVNFLITGCLFFLVYRVGYIKKVYGVEYEKIAVSQQVSKTAERVIPAKRGEILDTNGNKLAVTNYKYNLFLDIRTIVDIENTNTVERIEARNKKIDTIATILSDNFDFTKEEILDYYKITSNNPLDYTRYKVIKKDIPYTLAKKVEELLIEENIFGVHFEEFSKRYYTNNETLAHVLGFIQGDGITSWGLERAYNKMLTGKDGRLFSSYDDNGVAIINEVDQTSGYTIVTSIDLVLQQMTEEIVEKYAKIHNPQNASAIVMKTNTGEILSMASYPTFNPNEPNNVNIEDGALYYDYWLNFNVNSTFEPGSMFKPIVVAAALEENVINTYDTYYCNGSKTLSNGVTIGCWLKTGHGEQNVTEALANSCNVALMDIGETLGKDLYYKYQRDFGFGTLTEIDLPTEAEGKLHTLSNIRETELATGTMGQGFTATSIQNITALNSVINGGMLYHPTIVSKILDGDGNVIKTNYPKLNKITISDETSDFLRTALVTTVTGGTGKKAQISGFNIGGKTATGEQNKRGSGDHTVSFFAYLPAENPEYTILTTLHIPEKYVTGISSTVPMTKELISKMIHYYNIAPTTTINNESTLSKQFLESLTDKNVTEAINYVNRLNLDYELIGNGGKIEKHIPDAGSLISNNTKLFIYLYDDEEMEIEEVPNITELNMEVAVETLENLKFNVTKVFDEEIDILTSSEDEKEIDVKYKVTKQSPNSGVKIPIGSTIKLTLKPIN